MRTPRLGVVMIAAISALALLAAACSEEAAPPAQPEQPAEAPEQAAEEAAIPLDATFWYAGFKVDLEGAAVEVDEYGTAQLRLDATFENLGTQGAYFPGQDLYLDHQGTVIQYSQADVAEVPAGATTRGSLTFLVEEGFTPGQAVLYAGAPALHQAVVPLGASGTLHDCAPETVALAGTFQAGNLAVTITAAELRAWGFPYGSDGQQADAGTLLLALTVDITNESDWTGGASPDPVQLELPDGTTAVPANSVIEVVGPGDTNSDVLIEFVVSDAPIGDYVLSLTEWSVRAADDPVGTYEFSLV